MISLERRHGRPLRIGHRGAALLSPENTLASFRAAIAVGVDLVEFDVFGLSSGELVVAHSNDLHEVSHGTTSGRVRECTLDELRVSCPDLPTFAEALEFFASEAPPDVGLHVDLKERRAGREVAAELRRLSLEGRSFVSGFHRRALRDVRRVEPGIRTGISFPRDPFRIHGRRGAGHMVRAALWSLRAVTPWLVRPLLVGSCASALVLHHTVVGPAVVRRAHARGLAVVAWTVDDPADLARVDAAGVDAVVSNDPRIFLSTLPS